MIVIWAKANVILAQANKRTATTPNRPVLALPLVSRGRVREARRSALLLEIMIFMNSWAI